MFSAVDCFLFPGFSNPLTLPLTMPILKILNRQQLAFLCSYHLFCQLEVSSLKADTSFAAALLVIGEDRLIVKIKSAFLQLRYIVKTSRKFFNEIIF